MHGRLVSDESFPSGPTPSQALPCALRPDRGLRTYAQGGLLPFFDHGGVGGERQNPGASQVDFDHNLPIGLALVIVSHGHVDDVRCAAVA